MDVFRVIPEWKGVDPAEVSRRMKCLREANGIEFFDSLLRHWEADDHANIDGFTSLSEADFDALMTRDATPPTPAMIDLMNGPRLPRRPSEKKILRDALKAILAIEFEVEGYGWGLSVDQIRVIATEALSQAKQARKERL